MPFAGSISRGGAESRRGRGSGAFPPTGGAKRLSLLREDDPGGREEPRPLRASAPPREPNLFLARGFPTRSRCVLIAGMPSATNRPLNPGATHSGPPRKSRHLSLHGQWEHWDHSGPARLAAARGKVLSEGGIFRFLGSGKFGNLFSLELRPLNEIARRRALASRPPAPIEGPRPGGERRCAG
jgi:hypothetical protein